MMADRKPDRGSVPGDDVKQPPMNGGTAPPKQDLVDDPSRPAQEAEGRGEGEHPAGKGQSAGEPAGR
jgi:hypothetical protein